MSVCADYLFRDLVRTVPRGRPIADEEQATARTALERAEGMLAADPFPRGRHAHIGGPLPRASDCELF
jgi:hypothetical protein